MVEQVISVVVLSRLSGLTDAAQETCVTETGDGC